MSKTNIEILVDLRVLENKIFESGIDGGMATSDAIDNLNKYMVDNSRDIINMLQTQNLDLIMWKTKYNQLISEQNDQSIQH